MTTCLCYFICDIRNYSLPELFESDYKANNNVSKDLKTIDLVRSDY